MQRKRRFKQLINHECSPETLNQFKTKYFHEEDEKMQSEIFPFKSVCENLKYISRQLEEMVEHESNNDDKSFEQEKSDLFVNIDKISKALFNLSKKYSETKISLVVQEI